MQAGGQVDMFWCQGAQNIGLSNRKPKVHRMITMHARPGQTDRRTDGRTSWQ